MLTSAAASLMVSLLCSFSTRCTVSERSNISPDELTYLNTNDNELYTNFLWCNPLQY